MFEKMRGWAVAVAAVLALASAMPGPARAEGRGGAMASAARCWRLYGKYRTYAAAYNAKCCLQKSGCPACILCCNDCYCVYYYA